MNQRKAGAILSNISIAVKSIAGLVFISTLLIFLNKEQYGLYQLIGSMVAYLAVMDFGLSNTITRYYSASLHTQKIEQQQNILTTALIIYGVISALIVVTGLILLNLLLPFYTNTLSAAEMITAKHIFYIMLFNMAFIIPANIFTAIITSHERFIFMRCLAIVQSILVLPLVYAALYFKPAVLTVVIVQTLCNMLFIAVNMYFCMVKLKVKFKLHEWDNKLMRGVLAFSSFVFIAAIATQVYWKTGQLILGAVTGTEAVAVYSIAIQFAFLFITFSNGISSVFYPKLSAIAAETDNMAQINTIFIKVSRIQIMFIALIFTGFLIYGKQFIYFWLGNSFSDAYLYSMILMTALFIPLGQNTATFILQAKNKHPFYSAVYFIMAAVNIFASISMAKKYGALGCAGVTAACLIAGQWLIMNVYYAKMGIDIKMFFKNLTYILIPVLIVGFLGLAIEHISPPGGIFMFVFKMSAYTVIFIFSMYKFACNDYEKTLLQTPFKMIKLRKEFL